MMSVVQWLDRSTHSGGGMAAAWAHPAPLGPGLTLWRFSKPPLGLFCEASLEDPLPMHQRERAKTGLCRLGDTHISPTSESIEMCNGGNDPGKRVFPGAGSRVRTRGGSDAPLQPRGFVFLSQVVGT